MVEQEERDEIYGEKKNTGRVVWGYRYDDKNQ